MSGIGDDVRRHVLRHREGDDALDRIDVGDLQEGVGASRERVVVIDQFHPVVLAQAEAIVAAERGELDLHARAAVLRRFAGGALLDDREDHRTVFARPLEGGAAGDAAIVDLDAVELVLAAAIARVGGDHARILVRFGRLDLRTQLRAGVARAHIEAPAQAFAAVVVRARRWRVATELAERGVQAGLDQLVDLAAHLADLQPRRRCGIERVRAGCEGAVDVVQP